MPNPGISTEAYAKLLQAYREEPGNHTRAGKAAGVSPSTAKKYLERGGGGYNPIASELLREQQEARAVRQRNRQIYEDAILERNAEMAQAMAGASKDSAKTLQAEGVLLVDSRAQTHHADVAIIAPLLSAGTQLSARLAEYLQTAEIGTGEGQLHPDDAMSAVKDLVVLVGQQSLTKQRLIRAERDRLGDPREWIGDSDELQDLSQDRESAVKEAKSAAKALLEMARMIESGEAEIVDDTAATDNE